MQAEANGKNLAENIAALEDRQETTPIAREPSGPGEQAGLAAYLNPAGPGVTTAALVSYTNLTRPS